MSAAFYALLFDPDQFTCFGPTHKATRVSAVRPQTRDPFFTINALHPTRDLNPTEAYHAPDRPRRADHNVVGLRNVLLEMDSGSVNAQMQALERTRIPWSTCVWSGGKSLHFLISLETPLEDRMAYARLVKRVYQALADVGVDPANKNPSRFSRAPGVIRPETGARQDLLAVRARVPNAALEHWLGERLPPEVVRPSIVLPIKRIRETTLQFLAHGAPSGQWNTSLFRAACNLLENGHSLEEATARFRAITGVLDESDLSTIRSALGRVRTG